MRLRLVASASNSSFRRVTGTRSDKLPDMIFCEVEAIELMRRSTRTAVTTPATSENTRMPPAPSANHCSTMAVKPRRSTTSRPTTRISPLLSFSERTRALPWRCGELASSASSNGRGLK